MPAQPLYSPLRNSGQKRQSAQYVRQFLDLNALTGAHFAELFCGGAGVGLSLLYKGAVERLYLNDLDHSVFAFWHTALYEPEALQRFVVDVPLSATQWQQQRAVRQDPAASLIDLGQAALYLNRITQPARGGQIPAFVPDQHFSRRALSQHLARIARLQDRIRVSNLDAVTFLTTVAPNLPDQHLLFLDPPRRRGGSTQPQFEEHDATHLARVLRQLNRKWLLAADELPGATGPYGEKGAARLPEGDAQGVRQEGGAYLLAPGLRSPALRG